MAGKVLGYYGGYPYYNEKELKERKERYKKAAKKGWENKVKKQKERRDKIKSGKIKVLQQQNAKLGYEGVSVEFEIKDRNTLKIQFSVGVSNHVYNYAARNAKISLNKDAAAYLKQQLIQKALEREQPHLSGPSGLGIKESPIWVDGRNGYIWYIKIDPKKNRLYIHTQDMETPRQLNRAQRFILTEACDIFDKFLGLASSKVEEEVIQKDQPSSGTSSEILEKIRSQLERAST